jgi:hypothetical protein
MSDWLKDFVTESNLIEGIKRLPTTVEIAAHEEFLSDQPTVDRLISFVAAVQPGAKLRDKPGLDVRVGSHAPPPGGLGIRPALDVLLSDATTGGFDSHPYRIHLGYEILHPFTDGNGRSGRALWLWGMQDGGVRLQLQVQQLGFLHCWYYQSLHFSRVRWIGTRT